MTKTPQPIAGGGVLAADGHKYARCHPERRHRAQGLCAECCAAYYYARNAEKRKAQMSTYGKARRRGIVATPEDRERLVGRLRPLQQQVLDEARASKGASAAVPVSTGATLLSAFFGKRGAK